MRGWLALAALVALAPGCSSRECAAMTNCCAQVRGMRGLGAACSELAENARDPATCRSVTDTLRYMLEDRERPIPEACR